MSKFLEEGSLRKDSFFGRVVSAYKEYF
jgi:hypothetical protein